MVEDHRRGGRGAQPLRQLTGAVGVQDADERQAQRPRRLGEHGGGGDDVGRVGLQGALDVPATGKSSRPGRSCSSRWTPPACRVTCPPIATPRPGPLVACAVACLNAAMRAWPAGDGAGSRDALLARAMNAPLG
ncbi:hypothetical protein [Actinoplanes teichomyceticus]|uniref:Uncharacterized protein n=1 Tax=Actinoplanes teichomyceticus TaxID=1867 RepID=A0A561WRY1_ACTTI|nr:hypothetical protein [Actinoplanes teichomyceticus]TWG26594.1 hypothetical protein FHX34_1011582 [Actinoplanes teichomyceticus]GIF16922.1 hypothetical protein Ate01nite_69540 [Actinoplanes teichomyceticus]